ncbi:hypothetical protein V8C86DRAFT_2628282, partial [Haematococcus lacustris]
MLVHEYALLAGRSWFAVAAAFCPLLQVIGVPEPEHYDRCQHLVSSLLTSCVPSSYLTPPGVALSLSPSHQHIASRRHILPSLELHAVCRSFAFQVCSQVRQARGKLGTMLFSTSRPPFATRGCTTSFRVL